MIPKLPGKLFEADTKKTHVLKKEHASDCLTVIACCQQCLERKKTNQ